jgi:hypothetical protein
MTRLPLVPIALVAGAAGADIWLLKGAYHEARNRGLVARTQGGLAPKLYTGYPFSGREYSGKNPIAVKHTRQEISTAELGAYVRSPGFFINEHHRALFEKTHPKLHAYLMGTAPRPIRGEKRLLVPAEAASELKPTDDARLIEVLTKLGMTTEGGKRSLPSDFRFGDRLGEPLHNDRKPDPARFTGLMDRLGVLGDLN